MVSSGTFDKVAAGDRFHMKGHTYNAMIDAARAHAARVNGDAEGLRTHNTRPGMARVFNFTGMDQEQFAVLGIGGVAIPPLVPPAGVDDEEDHFKLDLMLTAEEPGADHRGRFCVLAEPIPDEEMGWAYVDDVVQVRLDVLSVSGESEDPMKAEIVEGDTTKLATAIYGSATVLWWEKRGVALPEVETGEQWAVVRLGCRPETFPVELEVVAGLPGGDFDPCTFVYDVKDSWTGALLPIAGSVSAGGLIFPFIFYQRPFSGAMRPATHGLATWGKDDTVQLIWINEVPFNVPTTFPVDLAKVGGLAGSAVAPCTFTYDVSDPLTGGVKLSAADPSSGPHRWQRPSFGEAKPATAGIAMLDGGGSVIVLWINEQPIRDDV